MNRFIIVTVILVGLPLGMYGEVIYDVDFEAPVHTIGLAPTTGPESDRPSQHNGFGWTIQNAVADFDSQVAVVGSNGYEYLSFTSSQQPSNGVSIISWDLAVLQLGDDPQANITIQPVDGPSPVAIAFMGDGEIDISDPILGTTTGIGTWNLSNSANYSLSINLDQKVYSFFIDGILAVTNQDYGATVALDRVNFYRPFGAPSYAIDNFRWKTIPPVQGDVIFDVDFEAPIHVLGSVPQVGDEWNLPKGASGALVASGIADFATHVGFLPAGTLGGVGFFTGETYDSGIHRIGWDWALEEAGGGLLEAAFHLTSYQAGGTLAQIGYFPDGRIRISTLMGEAVFTNWVPRESARYEVVLNLDNSTLAFYFNGTAVVNDLPVDPAQNLAAVSVQRPFGTPSFAIDNFRWVTFPSDSLIQYDIKASTGTRDYHWVYQIYGDSAYSYTNVSPAISGTVYTTTYSADFAALTESTNGTIVGYSTYGFPTISYSSLPPGHPNLWYRPPDYDPDPRGYQDDYEIKFRYWKEEVNGPNDGTWHTLGLILPSNYFDNVSFPYTPIVPSTIRSPSANFHVWSGTILVSATITVSVVSRPEVRLGSAGIPNDLTINTTPGSSYTLQSSSSGEWKNESSFVATGIHTTVSLPTTNAFQLYRANRNN